MLYLILCKSLTQAQRAVRALESGGITATLARAPQGLGKNGCGYAVRVRRRVYEAIELLRTAHIPFGKVYLKRDNGEYTEVLL